jgi:hypothetical protein
VIDDNDKHPSKQLFPRDLTEFGIARDVSNKHFSKQ